MKFVNAKEPEIKNTREKKNVGVNEKPAPLLKFRHATI